MISARLPDTAEAATAPRQVSVTRRCAGRRESLCADWSTASALPTNESTSLPAIKQILKRWREFDRKGSSNVVKSHFLTKPTNPFQP